MPKRRLTYEEMAQIEDEKVAQGREAEGIVRVNATVSSEVAHVMLVRFTIDELNAIQEQAKAEGMAADQYVHRTVLKSLEG